MIDDALSAAIARIDALMSRPGISDEDRRTWQVVRGAARATRRQSQRALVMASHAEKAAAELAAGRAEVEALERDE